MALTRKMLKVMGIEDEKIDQIIDAHTESTDALKKERDEYKAQADEVDKLKTQLEEAESNSEMARKYEKEHEAFEAYKKKVEKEKADGEKDARYRELLKEAGVDEKRIDSVMKVTSLDDVKVKDGKIEDADKITESIKTEWADFLVQQKNNPAPVANPPAGVNGGTDLDSLSIEDYIAARRKK